MKSKRISVSEKRQITIPKKFYEKMGIGDEVECFLDEDNGFILIRPISRDNDDFSEQILADLIAQGYSGENLLNEFKRMKQKVRPAVEMMIADADKAAAELNGSGDDQIKEIFADVKED